MLRPGIATECRSLAESWSPRHVILTAHVPARARPAAQDTPAAGPARVCGPHSAPPPPVGCRVGRGDGVMETGTIRRRAET